MKLLEHQIFGYSDSYGIIITMISKNNCTQNRRRLNYWPCKSNSKWRWLQVFGTDSNQASLCMAELPSNDGNSIAENTGFGVPYFLANSITDVFEEGYSGCV